MVSAVAKKLAARFKNAGWSGVGDNEHHVVDTPNGKWIVKVVLKPNEKMKKFALQIEVPAGYDAGQTGGASKSTKTYEAPSGNFRLREDAKKEANIWVKSLKKNGSAKLIGWKPVT